MDDDDDDDDDDVVVGIVDGDGDTRFLRIPMPLLWLYDSIKPRFLSSPLTVEGERGVDDNDDDEDDTNRLLVVAENCIALLLLPVAILSGNDNLVEGDTNDAATESRLAAATITAATIPIAIVEPYR